MPETLSSPTTIEIRPPGLAAGFCLLNWIIPGAGFIAAGDRKRGLALLVILNGIFFLGLLYSGAIFVPPLQRSDPNFNIFGALAFIVQCFHGGGVFLLLTAEQMGGPLGALLVRDPGGAFSDLGIFHFFTAGALNYFATARLWDLLRGNSDEEEPPAADRNDSPTGVESPERGSSS